MQSDGLSRAASMRTHRDSTGMPPVQQLRRTSLCGTRVLCKPPCKPHKRQAAGCLCCAHRRMSGSLSTPREKKLRDM